MEVWPFAPDVFVNVKTYSKTLHTKRVIWTETAHYNMS